MKHLAGFQLHPETPFYPRSGVGFWPLSFKFRGRISSTCIIGMKPSRVKRRWRYDCKVRLCWTTILCMKSKTLVPVWECSSYSKKYFKEKSQYWIMEALKEMGNEVEQAFWYDKKCWLFANVLIITGRWGTYQTLETAALRKTEWDEKANGFHVLFCFL